MSRPVTQKQKPFVSQRFRRDVVRLINCVASGQPAHDPHHIKGIKRGTGAKDDRLIIPLTREQHTLLHNDPKAWEAKYGLQVNHCRRVLEQVRHLCLLREDLIDEALLMIGDNDD